MPVTALAESGQRTNAVGVGEGTRLGANLSAELRSSHLAHQRTVIS